MGLQVGFAMAVQLDPVNQVEVPILATFLTVIMTLLYFVVDGHHLLLLALGSSFHLIPPFGAHLSARVVADGVMLMDDMYVLALKLTLPIMASTFFSLCGPGHRRSCDAPNEYFVYRVSHHHWIWVDDHWIGIANFFVFVPTNHYRVGTSHAGYDEGAGPWLKTKMEWRSQNSRVQNDSKKRGTKGKSRPQKS